MTTATPPRDSRSVRAFADRCFGSAFAHAELARALIELADDELGAGIDPGSVRLMRSTVLDPEWRSRLADWLVAATWLEPRGATPYPLEVVCEHMSRARPRYALRFALLAIERWRAGYRGRRARAAPRVLALLLYTGTHRWRDPEALMLRGRAPTPACLARYEPRLPLLVVDLHRTSPARLATAGSAGLLLRAWRARASRRAFTPALRRAMRGAMALGREHAALARPWSIASSAWRCIYSQGTPPTPSFNRFERSLRLLPSSRSSTPWSSPTPMSWWPAGANRGEKKG